jgi:hypothetical protein
MLDAYIIDRIRRERDREREEGSLIPLRIEPPPISPPRASPAEERQPSSDRGSVVIDFTL